MAANGRNLAYYILVVLTTVCRQAAKTCSVLFDAESFLGLFRLHAGFGCQRVRKGVLTLSATFCRTDQQLSETLWCLTLSRQSICGLLNLFKILSADLGMDYQRESECVTSH